MDDKLVAVNSDEAYEAVQYIYTNFVKISANNQEIRLVFGNVLSPKGERVRPILGLTMSHKMAQALFVVLGKQFRKIADLSDEEKTEAAKNDIEITEDETSG